MSTNDVSKENHVTNETTPSKGPLSVLSQSPGVKFVIIGLITILLLIPSLLVWGLVEERADRAEEVTSSIAKGWGDQQTINGPYLVIPYLTKVEEVKRVNNVSTVVDVERLQHAIFSPEQISMDADIEVTERKKSIYSVPLFHMNAGIKGEFNSVDLNSITDVGGDPKIENAFIAMGISDTAGFRSEVLIDIGNRKGLKFLPGLKGVNTAKISYSGQPRHYAKPGMSGSRGIHFPISKIQAQAGFKFDIKMALNGSRVLAFVPNGKNTELKVKSNWAHPGFSGRFLPETREISEDGFNANWTIPNLARGIDAVSHSSSLPNASNIQVNFVEPLKFYQIVSRTLKYSIAFFALIFLSVFILEFMGKRAVHWIQYILLGFAMVIFYILLLALAEHVGFIIAYITSATATTLLISWYVGASIGQKNGTVIMGAILGVLYTIIFLVLNEQEYAMLAGSIIAFLAIATTMYTTRNLDWSNHQKARA